MPNDQTNVGLNDLFFRRALLDLRDQTLGSDAAHCDFVDMYRGQFGFDQTAVFAVIESHDGDILRDTQSGAQHRLHRTDGDGIVGAEERGGAVAQR